MTEWWRREVEKSDLARSADTAWDLFNAAREEVDRLNVELDKRQRENEALFRHWQDTRDELDRWKRRAKDSLGQAVAAEEAVRLLSRQVGRSDLDSSEPPRGGSAIADRRHSDEPKSNTPVKGISVYGWCKEGQHVYKKGEV